MARPPKKKPAGPPAFVNIHGKPVDLQAVRAMLQKHWPMPVPDAAAATAAPPAQRAAARQKPPAPSAAAPAAGSGPPAVETVFDALCLAGVPRHAAWLLHFLQTTRRRTSTGAAFAIADVTGALAALRAAGRVVDAPGLGSAVPPPALAARLPALLADPDHAGAWQAWAAAASPYNRSTEPVAPTFRHHGEMVALARLVLHGGADLHAFAQVRHRVLGPAGDAAVLAEAVNTPFIASAMERMNGPLRHELLESFAAFDLSTPLWQGMRQWLDAALARDAALLPPVLRLRLAELWVDAGRPARVQAALAGISGPSVQLLQAASLAWSGRWADAVEAFLPALRDTAKANGGKRGHAPRRLLHWALLSLLAQPQAAGWAAARKLCVAESGARQPAHSDSWGLWAHAIAVRLGDEPFDPEAFTPWRSDWPPSSADDNAQRLILCAWLDRRADGWTADDLAATLAALQAAGKPWKADLVRQSVQRMQLPLPAAAGAAHGASAAKRAGTAADTAAPAAAAGDPDAAPWPGDFFGTAREPWRDALAAIEALGPQTGADVAPAATLHWRLQTDADGRVIGVLPFERGAGVRGPGKPKALTLSKVKKAARLDPRDAAVARCIDAERWSGVRLKIDVAGAAIALVNHPDLAFADAPEQPVELRESLPVLEVLRRPVAPSAVPAAPAAAGTAEAQSGARPAEEFVFHLTDPLLADKPPHVQDAANSVELRAEELRRDGLRVVRESPERARLIRVTPAHRRVAELVSKHWAVPADAHGELEGALRVLAGHFQLHSDATAGAPVAANALLHAQLTAQGAAQAGALRLRLRVQPFGSFGPALAPGRGRARLVTVQNGVSLWTERDLAAEQAHLDSVLQALPFLADSDGADGDGNPASWLLEDPEQALATVEVLPRLPAVAALEWPRGKAIRVTPLAAGAVTVTVAVATGSGQDWFGIAGTVRVDENRVLTLQTLLGLARDGSGRFIALGDGDYLALTEQLKRQLADLQALAQADGKHLRLPAAAGAWLDATLDGMQVEGDARWSERTALLAEAAALQPEPPAALQATLRGYQAEGYAWMLRLAHAGLGAVLADDMGLGKTVQTLALLLQRAALGPALVIAPTSVCGNWAAEAARFAPSLRVTVYADSDRRTALAAVGPGDLVIASYTLAQIESAEFGRTTWASLVLDEAQAVKNAATKRARAIATLAAGFRLALTGTPVENRLSELWAVMNLVNPGLLGSSGQFAERFGTPIERQGDATVRARLRRVIAPFLLRRTKGQVLTDLPPRTEIVHLVQPGPEERAFLEAMRREAQARIAAVDVDARPGEAGFKVLAELTRLRRAACDPRLVAPETGLVGAKVQEFEQLALELVAGHHKALVFSQFTSFLALLAERLTQAGISFQHLDGSTPVHERTRRVAAFQAGVGDLFLISLKAGGFGLNLTMADYVIIVDPWWNPAAEDQAMGRAHRIGQQRPVTVYRLVTADSVEEKIVALHRDKRSLADGILEGQDGAVLPSADELRALLQG